MSRWPVEKCEAGLCWCRNGGRTEFVPRNVRLNDLMRQS